VLFAADGRPVLTGVGVPSLLAPRRAAPGSATAPIAYPTPAEDLLALGRIVRFALSGGDPSAAMTGPLARLAAVCTAPNAAGRPLPGRIAALAEQAAPTAPIALALHDRRDEARRNQPAEPRRTQPSTAPLARTPTRALVLVAGSALLLALVLVPVLLRGGWPTNAAAQAGPGVPPASAKPLGDSRADPRADPRAVVVALAAARARALTAASKPALAEVDAPGSAALASDAAFVQRLHAVGVRLRGLAFDVSSTRLEEADAAHAIVRAHVSTSAHEEVGVDGRVLRRVPASQPRSVRLALAVTPDGWRITSDG
jgi:hypothetical protein